MALVPQDPRATRPREVTSPWRTRSPAPRGDGSTRASLRQSRGSREPRWAWRRGDTADVTITTSALSISFQ